MREAPQVFGKLFAQRVVAGSLVPQQILLSKSFSAEDYVGHGQGCVLDDVREPALAPAEVPQSARKQHQ